MELTTGAAGRAPLAVFAAVVVVLPQLGTLVTAPGYFIDGGWLRVSGRVLLVAVGLSAMLAVARPAYRPARLALAAMVAACVVVGVLSAREAVASGQGGVDVGLVIFLGYALVPAVALFGLAGPRLPVGLSAVRTAVGLIASVAALFTASLLLNSVTVAQFDATDLLDPAFATTVVVGLVSLGVAALAWFGARIPACRPIARSKPRAG